MAKARTAKPKKERKLKIVTGRAENIEESARAQQAAGEKSNDSGVVENSGARADDMLKKLGILNDRVLAAKSRWEGLKAQTKAARDEYDEQADELTKQLRLMTHPPEMPLFDQDQRERDLALMKAAAEQGGVELLPAIEGHTHIIGAGGKLICGCAWPDPMVGGVIATIQQAAQNADSAGEGEAGDEPAPSPEFRIPESEIVAPAGAQTAGEDSIF